MVEDNRLEQFVEESFILGVIESGSTGKQATVYRQKRYQGKEKREGEECI